MTQATVQLNMVSACRQKLATIVKATTGALSTISVSSGKFTRSSGSFVTDGFAVGDQIVSTGFAAAANNIVRHIKSVTATQLEVDGAALTNVAAGPAVTIVAAIPDGKAYEGVRYTPTPTLAYIADAYNPVSSEPAGIGGFERHTIQAIFTLYYPFATGRLPIASMAGLIRKAFAPRGGLFYGGDTGTLMRAQQGRIITEADWNNVTVTAEFVAYTAPVN